MSTCSPKACGRCEGPLERLDAAGRLFVWPPVGHSLAKLARGLAHGSLPFERRSANGCLVLDVGPAEASSAASSLAALLTAVRDAGHPRALRRGRARAGAGTTTRAWTRSPRSSAAQARGGVGRRPARREAPHIPLPADRRRPATRGACFASRGAAAGPRAGRRHAPATDLRQARDADSIPAGPGGAAARRSPRRSGAFPRNAQMFVNFTPTPSMTRRTACARRWRPSPEAGIAQSDVVFEVIESDRTVDAAHLKRIIIDFYRLGGFRVALDDLGAGNWSLNLIHKQGRHPQAGHGAGATSTRTAYKGAIVRKMLEICAELGSRPSVEGSRDATEELRWVREHGAAYVQGYLFVPPAPGYNYGGHGVTEGGCLLLRVLRGRSFTVARRRAHSGHTGSGLPNQTQAMKSTSGGSPPSRLRSALTCPR